MLNPSRDRRIWIRHHHMLSGKIFCAKLVDCWKIQIITMFRGGMAFDYLKNNWWFNTGQLHDENK